MAAKSLEDFSQPSLLLCELFPHTIGQKDRQVNRSFMDKSAIYQIVFYGNRSFIIIEKPGNTAGEIISLNRYCKN